MGEVADAFNTAFRDYVVEGVPGSGPNPPDKSEARALGALIETKLAAARSRVPLVGAAFDVSPDHENKWLAINDGSGATLTIKAAADVAMPVPCSVYGYADGAGPVTIANDPGVTLLFAEDCNPVTRARYAPFQLEQLEEDVWLLFGALELA
jgi:hypothetical protein